MDGSVPRRFRGSKGRKIKDEEDDSDLGSASASHAPNNSQPGASQELPKKKAKKPADHLDDDGLDEDDKLKSDEELKREIALLEAQTQYG